MSPRKTAIPKTAPSEKRSRSRASFKTTGARTGPASRKRAPREGAVEAPPTVAKPVTDAEARYRAIAEAAYLRAEKRGFAPGGEVDDWLAAEAEVDARKPAD